MRGIPEPEEFSSLLSLARLYVQKKVFAILGLKLPCGEAVAGQSPRRLGLGRAGRGQSWVSQMTPSGGTTIDAEAGRPCQGIGTASTAPMLPTPLPP